MLIPLNCLLLEIQNFAIEELSSPVTMIKNIKTLHNIIKQILEVFYI